MFKLFSSVTALLCMLGAGWYWYTGETHNMTYLLGMAILNTIYAESNDV